MYLIPVCDGCMRAYPIMIILKDDLWQTIAPFPGKKQSGLLCRDCMEDRLGRRLTLDDMKDCGNTRTMILGAAIAMGINTPCFAEDLFDGRPTVRVGADSGNPRPDEYKRGE